ncbi:MAG: metalloregulator ArsR/SmtB family transcription factor [Cyclobacteriaceae bacterium]|nr:metalloregulator ArsR/SmtB family transcription factor [Cyclobacteriaceae bacterium]
MGASKLTDYTNEEITLARYAKALSHPARIAILNVLLQRNVCVCGDIVDELPLSQSTVSQHLKELKIAGLIKGDIEGASICYCINETEWSKAKEHFTKWFQLYDEMKSKCC